MTDTKIIRTIQHLERLNNSTAGNPRWRIHTTNGETYLTQSDASVGYGLENPELRNVPIEFTLTSKGRIRYAKPTN